MDLTVQSNAHSQRMEKTASWNVVVPINYAAMLTGAILQWQRVAPHMLGIFQVEMWTLVRFFRCCVHLPKVREKDVYVKNDLNY